MVWSVWPGAHHVDRAPRQLVRKVGGTVDNEGGYVDMGTPPPDGINPVQLEPSSGRDNRANPLPLLILAALMVVALLGLLGGQPDRIRRVESDAAVISVRSPAVLRSGMFFETVVEVTAKRPVDNLIIALSDGLWRQMTVNSMIPAAEEEKQSGGFFRFAFGKLEQGETLRFKIDGQINPPLFAGTRGEIVALDGKIRLAGLNIAMKVRP